MSGQSRRALTRGSSVYSDATIHTDDTTHAANLRDYQFDIRHHRAARVAHLSDTWPGTGGRPRTTRVFHSSDGQDDISSGDTLVKPYQSEDGRHGVEARDSHQGQVTSVFVRKVLSFHRPKLITPNIFIRNARTGEALYLAEMPGSISSTAFTLHRGDDLDGPIAARVIPGRGFQAPSRVTARPATLIENIPDYETAVNTAQKSAPIEKRLTGQASSPITWKQGTMRRTWTLVDSGTGAILARYVKVTKKEADSRIGYLEIKSALLVDVAEALTVLMLCMLLEGKRLKSNGRKRGWAIGGAFAALAASYLLLLLA